MTASGPPTTERFLEAFFGSGNDLDLNVPSVASSLAPWMERVHRDDDRVLLPRLTGPPPLVVWYALSRSARDARAFREELLAAVGPSYTDFQGVAAQLDPADPVDAAVLAYSGDYAFKLRLVDPTQKTACNKALDRMLRLHQDRPAGRSSRPRSRGRVLMDFRLALRQREFYGADDALTELREHGHLDAWNLEFLRIQRWEASEEWDRIREKLDQGSLPELRRPVRVTEALLRALYRPELMELERGFRPAQALAHYRAEIEPRYASLLTTRVGMRSPEVDALFMLKAAASDSAELRDAVLQGAFPDPRRRAWIQALAELVTPAAPQPQDLDPALLAFSMGDSDRAFELLLQGAGGEGRVPMMLRCAVDIGTLRAAELAIETLYALPPEQIADLRRQRSLDLSIEALEELCTAPADDGEQISPTSPEDWLDWIQRLDRGELDENQSLQTATRGAQEWGREHFASRPGDVRSFAELLQLHRADAQAEQLRLALPALMEFFLPESGPSPAFQPVLMTLIQRLAYEDRRSSELLQAMSELVAATLGLGLDRDTYRELGNEICDLVLNSDLSPEHIDWGLDLLELLLTLSPPDPTTTQRISTQVRAWIHAWGDRIPLRSRKLFNALSDEFELGLALPLPSDADTPTQRGLAELLHQRTLALYSLNEGALERVRRSLEQEIPSLRMRTFHDKAGGSPALLEAARNADVFAIVTAAATHAATNFIEDNRPAEKSTLRHHAQGSASLLRALESFVLDRWG